MMGSNGTRVRTHRSHDWGHSRLYLHSTEARKSEEKANLQGETGENRQKGIAEIAGLASHTSLLSPRHL